MCVCIYIYYIYIYIYIYIIIHHHVLPLAWISLTLPRYSSLSSTGLLGYILCLHRVGVDKF